MLSASTAKSAFFNKQKGESQMADQVTVAQKLFEKYVMLSANNARLTVVMVRDPRPAVVVALQEDDGGFTPLARLLTKEEIEGMTPDFDKTRKLALAFQEARAVDHRTRSEEFGDGKPHPLFSMDGLDRLGL